MELKNLQSLSLEEKIERTERIIQEWYEYYDGNVHISFSGGKDSTVLLDIARNIYCQINAVFVDTGLEYPEIRNFVKTKDGITWVRPKKTFFSVIENYGYPVVSKTVSRYIEDMKEGKNNYATKILRLTGYNQKGIYCPSMKLPKKWHFLIEAPFKISSKCCDVLKKDPLHRYEKTTGSKPITGTRADESRARALSWKRSGGCNAFKSGISSPLSFWTDNDIEEYIIRNSVTYSEIYDMGERRTGCMFCMFGVHLEKGQNRFQRMKKTHPKQYKYCIENLGLGDVLDYMGIKY